MSCIFYNIFKNNFLANHIKTIINICQIKNELKCITNIYYYYCYF